MKVSNGAVTAGTWLELAERRPNKTMNKFCAWCGTRIPDDRPKRKQAKYCSDACQREFRAVYLRDKRMLARALKALGNSVSGSGKAVLDEQATGVEALPAIPTE